MKHKIHITDDGSSTLYSEKFEQYYHNPNGAASESLYVFFETSGLIDFLESADSLTVLEVGFGTGLNFLLLLDILKQKNLQLPVSFYSVEAFPVDAKTAKEFEFRNHLSNPELNDLLPGIFENLKKGMNHFKPVEYINADLNLFVGTFDNFKPGSLQADYIIHDAFSPEVNGELWTADTFSKLASFSKDSTVLTTYCAASKARGAMCASDWYVARAQGALGKREMTIAARTERPLQSFKRVNEERLAKRYKAGDFD